MAHPTTVTRIADNDGIPDSVEGETLLVVQTPIAMERQII